MDPKPRIETGNKSSRRTQDIKVIPMKNNKNPARTIWSGIDFLLVPPKNYARQRTRPRSAGAQSQAQGRTAKGVGFKRQRPVLRVVRPLVGARAHTHNQTPHPQGQWSRSAKCQRAHASTNTN